MLLSKIPLQRLVIFCFTSIIATAAEQELGLTLGRLGGIDRTSNNEVAFQVGSGTALQANYGYRLGGVGIADLYVGVHFLASPQRSISSTNATLTRDVASLYITPNLIVKVFPRRRIVPWGTIGGGYGDYEQSTTVLSGAVNGAPRQLERGVFMFGAGVDVPIWRFVALRGEVRDFYTGNPAYNVPLASSQHNVVAGAGLVLRFGRR